MSRSFTPSGNGECPDWCCPWYGRLKAAFDEFRHAIERIPPAQYLASSYYERWLAAAEILLVERGGADARTIAGEGRRVDRSSLDSERGARSRPNSVKDKSHKKPPRARFVKGDRVRGRNLDPFGAHSTAALCPRQVRSDRARLGRVRLLPTPKHIAQAPSRNIVIR